jgi:nitrite reductase (NADH) small subunit
MTELVKICTVDELPANGHAKEVLAGHRMLCLANVDGELAAMDNVCPHRGGPLAEGLIENGKVVCPWHAWEFDPRSGECSTVSGITVEVYRITTTGDDVFVEVQNG